MTFVIPIVFVLGAMGGFGLAWHWRGKGGADGDGTYGRWQKAKLVLATALATTLLLAVVGYGALRYAFRKTKVKRASVGQAVKDFHKAQSNSALAPGGKTPAVGVYQYQGTGYYEIVVPGMEKDKRVMPATIPGILVADGDCWDLTVRYFKQHQTTSRFCRSEAGKLESHGLRNKNEFFGYETDTHTVCTPKAALGPEGKIGGRWTLDCKNPKPMLLFGKPKVDVQVTYLGLETVDIGGTKVQTHRITRVVNLKGLQNMSVVRDSWFDVKSGMMVQFSRRGTGGGLAKFTSNYKLTLKSLNPTK